MEQPRRQLAQSLNLNCSKCDCELRATYKFCPSCGARVEALANLEEVIASVLRENYNHHIESKRLQLDTSQKIGGSKSAWRIARMSNGFVVFFSLVGLFVGVMAGVWLAGAVFRIDDGDVAIPIVFVFALIGILSPRYLLSRARKPDQGSIRSKSSGGRGLNDWPLSRLHTATSTSPAEGRSGFAPVAAPLSRLARRDFTSRP